MMISTIRREFAVCCLGLKHLTLLQNSSKFGVILVYLTNMLEFISVLSNSKLQRNGGSQVIYGPLTAKQLDHTNKHRELNSSGCCFPVLNDSQMLLSFSPLPDTQVSPWAVVPSAVMEDQHSPPPLQMTVKDTNEN